MPYYPAKGEPIYDAVAQVRDGSNLQKGLQSLAAAIAGQHPAQAGFYVDLAEALSQDRRTCRRQSTPSRMHSRAPPIRCRSSSSSATR
ncbi:MAG: hypothetical protein WDO73_15715 [Ignavibacteriota bacterium]